MNYENIGLDLEKISKIEHVKSISKKILKHIPMNLGEYSDHGIKHCENIEDYFELFFRNNQIKLTTDEKFLIILTIWTHDLGNILCREHHELYSIEFLVDSIAFSSLEDAIGPQLFKALQIVIRAHRSKFDFSNISDKPVHPYVNLKLVCAVFRLIDGCDISKSRISNALYEILKKYRPLSKTSESYWEAHQNITGIMFLEQRIIIIVKDYEKAKLLTDDFSINVDKINKVFSENGYPIFTIEYKNEDEYIIN